MYSEVYIDLVFLSNFLMDYVLLRVTGVFFRCRKSRIRMLAAAALGALSTCMVLVCDVRSRMGLLFFHGAAALLMLWLGLGLKKGSLLLRAMLTLYLTAFLCGGAWEVASRGNRLTLRTFLLFTAGTFLALSTWNVLSDSFRARMQNIFPVVLSFGGRQISVYGFYDTGNLLEDPVNHRPVSVVEPEVLGRLVSTEVLEKLKKLTEEPGELQSTELMRLRPRFLPYSTVGSRGALILTVTLDDLCIHAPGEEVHIPGPLVALPAEPFTLGKEYKVLLNAKLLNGRGRYESGSSKL